MNLPINNYDIILTDLKEKIRRARAKASIALNAQMLAIYWEIGNVILTQQETEGWGSKVIDRLSIDLKSEFPDMKGFSPRNLKYMRAFAEAYPDFVALGNHLHGIVQVPLAQLSERNQNQFVQEALAQITWYHHITLLDKVKDKNVRLFYIHETIKNGWSRDIMVHQIESGLHNRQGQISNNFSETVPLQSELIQQIFKDPYKFDFISLGKEAKERDLEDALINHIKDFLLEMGHGFAFMGRQVRLTLGDKEYFFDLLFYHTKLKRYIIIDLKIDEFKPEYKGKMEFYLSLADDHLREEGDEGSIGLILCKTKDGLVAEYALRDSKKPIGIAEYKITESLPKEFKGQLPSIEELEAEIEKEYEELKTPSEKRFEALKEKLTKLKGEEIKQVATTPILFEIIDKSLVPLYASLINKMEDFKDWFVSRSYQWQGKGQPIKKLEKLAENWKNEEFLKSNFDFFFSYRFEGLKKANTEAFDVVFQLNFKVDVYWYGFFLINSNNNQPILKKLYHEQLTSSDIESVVDIVYNFIIDGIERHIEMINRSN